MTTSAPSDGISISVITTTRNAATQLPACLASVAGQTHPWVEHVIVDGASTDDTAAIVRAHARPNFKFVSEPDRGIYDAMNKGVSLATGKYLLFLGADDYLADKDVLKRSADFLAREGLPDIVYANLEVREEGRPTSIFRPPPPEKALEYLVHGCLPHQSTLARRTLFNGALGAFDLKYRVHADYDWFLRVFATPGISVRYFPKTIGSFRMGGTSSQLQKGQEEFFAIQNAYPRYAEPQWLERRIREFQRQTLEYRLEAQQLRASGLRLPYTPRPLARRILGRLVRLIRRNHD
jgi:glycosyltransferase involved in cell wall biosynthesis